MADILSKRRMVENEVFFRSYNEKIQKGLDELEKMAKEDNQEFFVNKDDCPLEFFCECSDENCRKRIRIQPSRYNEIHKKRDHFVIVIGHEVQSIEAVISNEEGFCIVKKTVHPPEKSEKLNKTNVNNV